MAFQVDLFSYFGQASVLDSVDVDSNVVNGATACHLSTVTNVSAILCFKRLCKRETKLLLVYANVNSVQNGRLSSIKPCQA